MKGIQRLKETKRKRNFMTTQSSNTHNRQNRLKTKAIKKAKGYYIMVNRSIQKENITLVNIYVPNISTPKIIKKKY